MFGCRPWEAGLFLKGKEEESNCDTGQVVGDTRRRGGRGDCNLDVISGRRVNK